MQPTDSNKKTRLIIQDFNKLSLLKHDYPPLSREISLQQKTTHKRSILSNLKS